MAQAEKKRTKAFWAAYLAAGTVATVVYLLMPSSWEQSALYPLVALSSAVAVVVGVLLHRPIRLLPWYLLALGPFVGAAADAIWFFYDEIVGTAAPYPSIADALYALYYLFVIVGILLVQRGAVGDGRAALIDPLIIGIGAGLLSWVFLMQPYAEDRTLSLLVKATSITLPLLGVLLLAVLARLMMVPDNRVPSFYLLGTSVALMPLGDVVYCYQSLEGTYSSGGFLDATYLFSYVLFGAAALHPSMRVLSDHIPAGSRVRLSRIRLALLGAASLTAPAILLAQSRLGGGIDAAVIAGGSAMMFLLTLVRMEGLVGALVRTLSEREVLQKKLERQALHDSLTGLANRELFSDRLGLALARAERLVDRRPAILMLDLDDFKSVNDSLGHEAGDELLVSVAGRMSGCLRSSDTAARLGGDEFAVLLEDVSDPDVAIRAADRLLAVLAEPHLLVGSEVSVAASVGIAVGSAGQDSDGLLRDADVALYAAKTGGKKRHEVFHPGMRRAKSPKRRLDPDLRSALQNEEFVVHYQPIVSLDDGGISGVEALVRWQHPSRGLVPPDEFIPAAERNGLIVPIGRWVVRQACRQMRAWKDRYPAARDLSLAVNLSARQLSHPDLVGDIRRILQETVLEPRCLGLEITEGSAVEDLEATAARLAELKALGVLVALDDFGTGYSALKYLDGLPVDTLKIDRAFVTGIEHNPRSLSIVGAVISFATSLDLGVVAEGIETAGQAKQLRALGCELGQGFHFHRPLAADALEPMIAALGERPHDRGTLAAHQNKPDTAARERTGPRSF